MHSATQTVKSVVVYWNTEESRREKKGKKKKKKKDYNKRKKERNQIHYLPGVRQTDPRRCTESVRLRMELEVLRVGVTDTVLRGVVGDAAVGETELITRTQISRCSRLLARK
eukprot:m.203797 g.203797  ORF g.203797 m.203797 type:complete len:112 (-) comp16879_c5_seq2:5271-5606(-)